MKKTLLVGAIALGTFAFSQEIHYGIVGGLNVTNLRNDWVSKTDFMTEKSKIGGYAGGYIYKTLSDKGEVFGEVAITTIGAKFVDKQGNASEDFSFNANGTMLHIPLYYQYNFNDKFSFHGGGYLGLILSLNGAGSNEFGGNVKANTLDLGLLGGLKYKITSEISGVVRYNLGLLDIDADTDKNSNSIFQIGIQYQLK